MAMHTIRTTQQPGVQITVDEAEYQQLFAWGLIYNGTAPLTPADFYDSEIADRVTNGTATPAALRAAFVPFWKAAEAVTGGTVRMSPTGQTIVRNSSGTTRGSYDATEQALWTVTSGVGGGGAYTDEQVRDVIGAALVAGTGVTITPNDAADTITIASTGGGGAATTDASQLTSGILPAARIADGSIADAKLASGTSLTAAERTKLTGVATGATANSTDAQLRDRSTHTGTQAASTVTGLAGAVALVPTATKTAAYTAAVGDLAMMNVAGGATALTLPAAPADKSQVGYRAIGATTTVPLTVTAGGSDSIGTAGATTATVALADEVVVLQYQAASTRWLAVANVKTQASLDATTKTALAPVSRRSYQPRGKIVWIVDDAQIEQYTQAMPKIEAAGGKMNFAVPTSFIGLSGAQMSAAQVTDAYNRGHQILSHSVTHPNMTTQTAAQRQTEWDTSKTGLEALTAVGAITDFVMPNNASNITTQTEAYLRYLRVFTAQQAPTIFAQGENGLHIGRNTWSTATHQQFLAQIRRIAATGETYVIFCHSVATADASSAINGAMLDEAIALTTSLGVQWVRSDEALVGHQPILDGGFESGDISFHAKTAVAGTSTISIVADTPATGLSGTQSLQIVGDGTGQNILTVGTIGVMCPRPSEEYTASCRIRQEKTSGTGGGTLLVRQWDEFGNNLGDVNTTPITTVGSTPWTQVSIAFVPNKLTRSMSVRCMQTAPGLVGSTFFDHVHIAPTRMGVYG